MSVVSQASSLHKFEYMPVAREFHKNIMIQFSFASFVSRFSEVSKVFCNWQFAGSEVKLT